MELKHSKFVCGACIFSTKEGECKNKKIVALIDLSRGCCNLYQPREDDALDSSEWKINENN
jgi:hypothetical protein